MELRGWRPGDHYRPARTVPGSKIKEMFQKARVPSWRRRFWPIVTSGSKILWARGFGAAAEFAVGSEFRSVTSHLGRKRAQGESFTHVQRLYRQAVKVGEGMNSSVRNLICG